MKPCEREPIPKCTTCSGSGRIPDKCSDFGDLTLCTMCGGFGTIFEPCKVVMPVDKCSVCRNRYYYERMKEKRKKGEAE